MKKKWPIAILVSLLPLAAFAGDAPAAAAAESGVPRLSVLPPQRVLTLEAKGDPNTVAGQTYEKLFNAFFANADKAAKRHLVSAMARWPAEQVAGPKDQWTGVYALPIPDDFPTPPAGMINIETWQYGTVAEILHVGSYADEAADITRLKEFIAVNGLAINGPHEEVYVRGPGMFFRGNPRKYKTLIRYNVERVGEATAPIAAKP